jgi:hypothetical protein
MYTTMTMIKDSESMLAGSAPEQDFKWLFLRDLGH